VVSVGKSIDALEARINKWKRHELWDVKAHSKLVEEA
jgi:hypothetical protein